MSDVAKQFIAHVVKSSVADPIVMPGSSDGGAHLASFVGADYTTRLLTDWVPDPLSLEQAIWRNTLMPATVHGITDRGILREGAFADVLAIDLGALAAGSSHLRRDFPADSERYVVEAEGYRAMVVNGEVLMEDGRHTGALPGMVLKGG
jgi:N-acyl-D-aspartate/D-glutamate deacylase